MSNFTDNDAIIATYHKQAKAKNLSGDTQGAIDDYAKIINLKPDDIVSRINIGNIYYKQRQYEKALDVYNKVFSIISDNDDMMEIVKENREKVIHKYVFQLLEQATQEYESKNYNKVFTLTDKILMIDCNNMQARIILIKAKYYEVLGLFAEDETLKNLNILEKEAVNDNNRNILGQIYEFRGNIAFENTKYRKALNYFTFALEKGDLSNYASNNLRIMRGRCYFALNQYREALLDYIIACSNTQNDSMSVYLNINIYLNEIFDVYRENNEFPSYLYDIDLCKISPFLYIENLEYVLNHSSEDGKFELAIEIISTVLDCDEYEEDYHYFLKGKLYYENNQYKEALAEFNTAIEFNNQNGDYFYLDDFASGEFEDGLIYDFAYSNSSYNLYSIYGIGDNFALCELLDATGANRHMANPIVLGDDALFHQGDVFGGESEFAGFYEDFRFDGNGVNGPELGLTIEVESVDASGASLLLSAK